MSGLEGTSLGRYILKRRLGRGGMAEVYLATDDWMHRDVAIKVVSNSQMEFVERFEREATAIGNLHHDHILPAYDYGEQELWHYLVMPYIEYGTLSDLLQKGPLTLAHAGELLEQIADGLQYAHRQGLIHRDIKPSNILLRDEHHTYLADFGLARTLEGGKDLTQTGTLLGTPEYMAPEMADGPAGKSSDVYALAILLYQMIAGQVPFQGESAISVFWKHIRDDPQPPSHFNPLIPPAVDRVLMRALEKDPTLRYPTPLSLYLAYQKAINVLEKGSPLYESEIVQNIREQPELPLVSVSSTSILETSQGQMVPSSGKRIAGMPRGMRRINSPITPVLLPVQNSGQTEEAGTKENIGPLMQAPVLSRRHRSSRLMGGIVIGLVFLLVVSSLLAFLAIQAHGQNSVSSLTTVQLNATASVVAGKTRQTPGTQVVAPALGTAQIQETQQALGETATVIVGRTPLLSDPLGSPDSNDWPDNATSCSFQNNSYSIAVSSASTLQPCISGTLQYSDAAFEVHVVLVSGDDAGLVFRSSSDGSQFYDFEITSNGEFYFRDRSANQYIYLIHNTVSRAIQPLGSPNTLLVLAIGPNFQFFINGTFVGKVQNSTFASGQLGLVAGTLRSTTARANFTNLEVYPAS